MLQVPVNFILTDDGLEARGDELPVVVPSSDPEPLYERLRVPLVVAGNTFAGAVLFMVLLSLPWLMQGLLHLTMN